MRRASSRIAVPPGVAQPTSTPVVGAALLLATTAGFFSLFALSVLGPFIIPDLGLSRAAFGSLSSMLYLSAGLWSFVAGGLVDRVPGRRALLAVFATAAVAWLVIATARSLPLLLVGTAVAGLPMALAHPVTTQVVRTRIPAGRRGAYLGLSQAGSQVGGLLAGAGLPALAVQFGWRVALGSAGLIAAVGAGLTARLSLAAGHARSRTPRAVLDRRSLGWLAVYGFVMNAGATTTTAYLPLFAHESVGLSVQVAGSIAVVVGTIAIAAKVAWGRITESAHAVRRPLASLAVVSLAAVASLSLATEARPVLLWVGVVLFSLGVVSWSVLVVTTLARSVPADALGRATGRVMLVSFLGAAIAPVGFGWLIDLQGSYRGAWVASVGLYLVALAALTAWSWADRRRPPEAS